MSELFESFAKMTKNYARFLREQEEYRQLIEGLDKPPVEDFKGYDVRRRLQIHLNKRIEE